MIKEAYVSVEVAKLLKEKGFDIPVNYEYHYIIKNPHFHRKKHNFNGIEYRNCSSEWYSAPTQQMVMRWLREVHNLHIDIDPSEGNWNPTVISLEDWSCVVKFGDNIPIQDTYEEAVEAALKYCLEKLI